MQAVKFTVLGKPQPQGSIRAFMIGGKPRLTSANAKMKPWRQEVGMMALRSRPTASIYAGRHVPVCLRLDFWLAPPQKMPKGRIAPTAKPDSDKLARSACDAMTGILWNDDSQVVELYVRKRYGLPERTEIEVNLLQERD